MNGSLATARLVSELTEEMINVASQHDHQKLLQPQYHLDFIDTLGDLWPSRLEFGRLFLAWQEKQSLLQELQQKEQDKEQRRDFLQFQAEEIRAADPVAIRPHVLSAISDWHGNLPPWDGIRRVPVFDSQY